MVFIWFGGPEGNFDSLFAGFGNPECHFDSLFTGFGGPEGHFDSLFAGFGGPETSLTHHLHVLATLKAITCCLRHGKFEMRALLQRTICLVADPCNPRGSAAVA